MTKLRSHYEARRINFDHMWDSSTRYNFTLFFKILPTSYDPAAAAGDRTINLEGNAILNLAKQKVVLIYVNVRSKLLRRDFSGKIICDGVRVLQTSGTEVKMCRAE